MRKSVDESEMVFLCLKRLVIASFFVSTAFAQTVAVTSEELLKKLETRIHAVREFKSIAEYAKRKKIRVWLAGGTAAGLIHRVRSEIEHEKYISLGLESPYYEKRLAYNYYDIYRANQDADLVIDGNEKDAQEFESFLNRKFSYLEGSKSLWEVRLLNQSRGSGIKEKEPLLGKNFQNQNSDSHSTGMLELSEPAKNESRIRDLFDWKNLSDSQFFIDVVNRKLHFYRNPGHKKTKRYLAGWNPEILSVIRLYVKAFQYGLEIEPESQKVVDGIIKSFKPKSESDQYLKDLISKNALKLFWHSQDVEHSWLTLEKSGLRKKLMNWAKLNSSEDLQYTLNRKPLFTSALGKKGKTAKELGINLVSHETITFEAYENITRSVRGKVNAFVSRISNQYEAAAYGEGFYALSGKSGAKGTGLTIRMQVHPDAREGEDFEVNSWGSQQRMVLIKNAAAVRVLDESVEMEFLAIHKFLKKNWKLSDSSTDEKGFVEKMRLRLQSAGPVVSSENEAETLEVIRSLKDNEFGRLIASIWVRAESCLQYPKLIPKLSNLLNLDDIENAICLEKLNLKSEFFSKILSSQLKDSTFYDSIGFTEAIVNQMLEYADQPQFFEWLDLMTKHSIELKAVFHTENTFLDSDQLAFLKNESVRKHPHYQKWTQYLIDGLLKNQKPEISINFLLYEPKIIKNYPNQKQLYETILKFVSRRPDTRDIVSSILSSDLPHRDDEILDALESFYSGEKFAEIGIQYLMNINNFSRRRLENIIDTEIDRFVQFRSKFDATYLVSEVGRRLEKRDHQKALNWYSLISRDGSGSFPADWRGYTYVALHGSNQALRFLLDLNASFSSKEYLVFLDQLWPLYSQFKKSGVSSMYQFLNKINNRFISNAVYSVQNANKPLSQRLYEEMEKTGQADIDKLVVQWLSDRWEKLSKKCAGKLYR